jgi:hypothetical protein
MAAAVAAILCTVASSRLVVYGPQELKDKFEYSGKIWLIIKFRL